MTGTSARTTTVDVDAVEVDVEQVLRDRVALGVADEADLLAVAPVDADP